MPCWEINTLSVDLNSTDEEVIENAIKALGYKYTKQNGIIRIKGTGISISNGKVTYNNYDTKKVMAIKKQCGIETVKKSMKKSMWTGTWKTNKEGKPCITITKW